MTKPLPERLREAARNLVEDPRNPECEISRALCPNLCSQHDSCWPSDTCLPEVLEAMASEIEREYVKAPGFADDGARDLFLNTLAEMADANVSKTVRVNRGDMSAESLKLVFEPPKDTLEAIERDSALYWGDYAANRPGVTTQREMVFDLLRRQRAVLERDAPKAEERTCRNENYTGVPFICSECGYQHTQQVTYCPHCGAKVVK